MSHDPQCESCLGKGSIVTAIAPCPECRPAEYMERGEAKITRDRLRRIAGEIVAIRKTMGQRFELSLHPELQRSLNELTAVLTESP